MSERKMASVRRVDAIKPIEGADAIELAMFGGWQVVVKKGEYKEGDWAVYFELDSFIPESVAPFLTKPGHFAKKYNGVEGNLLKTIKLRGALSQGLVLPLPEGVWSLGDDLTEYFGIQKYEPPVDANTSGLPRGNFPAYVPKTDQERIQNLAHKIEEWKEAGYNFEVTEKMEGSSISVITYKDEFHVCSRNLSLKETEGNSFWDAAKVNDLHIIMQNHPSDFAIQGELLGGGIQGNIYKLDKPQMLVYDVFDIRENRYINAWDRTDLCLELGLCQVPFIECIKLDKFNTVQDLIDYATAPTKFGNNPKQLREGVVFKCIEDPSISFKVISNDYLLKQK